jgi:hypothetical protein
MLSRIFLIVNMTEKRAVTEATIQGLVITDKKDVLN